MRAPCLRASARRAPALAGAALAGLLAACAAPIGGGGGDALPGVSTPAGAAVSGAASGAASAVDANDALRRRCAGHMYAERALRGGRGPLNRFHYDRCVAQGASR